MPTLSAFGAGALAGVARIRVAGTGFQAWVDNLRKTGYRPVFLNGYAVTQGKGGPGPWGSQPLYAGIAVKDGQGQFWEARHGLTPEQYGDMATRLTAQGYRPDSICGHLWEGALRYSSIWVKD